MSTSIASVTARLRAEVAAEISLFRVNGGGGYFLLTFSRDAYYLEQSVLVPRIRDLSMTQWLQEGAELFAAAKSAIAASEARNA